MDFPAWSGTKQSNHTWWYVGRQGCGATIPRRENDRYHRGDSIQASVLLKTEPIQAGREGHALVVMPDPFQRHSLSKSPKAYVSFFRLLWAVSLCLCVFSVVVVHLASNLRVKFSIG
jgi:hypothetical protein